MQFSGKGPLVAGVLAAIGASVCCVGPLVLLALGIGGSWVSSLTAMDPYRPVFIGLTLLFLGLAFRKLYLVPRACTPGTACAEPRTLERQRLRVLFVRLGAMPANPTAARMLRIAPSRRPPTYKTTRASKSRPLSSVFKRALSPHRRRYLPTDGDTPCMACRCAGSPRPTPKARRFRATWTCPRNHH